jgi:hypothetical protein
MKEEALEEPTDTYFAGCREDIADHSNVFDFGDSGGILAMVRHQTHGPADHMKFSMDEGRCWNTVNFSQAINVVGIKYALPLAYYYLYMYVRFDYVDLGFETSVFRNIHFIYVKNFKYNCCEFIYINSNINVSYFILLFKCLWYLLQGGTHGSQQCLPGKPLLATSPHSSVSRCIDV